ncbi:MAG: hypothetical protein MJY94_01510 [Bacteroidales bacterium]|nr:hypothetical protein [Bacteroidales bacterium]
MLLTYIIINILAISALLSIRRMGVAAVSVLAVLAAQAALTVYAFLNPGSTALEFFTFDATGSLMLGLLTIVSIPAFVHSAIYVRERDKGIKAACSYFAFLVLLQFALSMGYIANHIAMTWVFTEVTTLSAAMLVYHHHDKLSLEGAWKYTFICAISISLVFVGILFMSLSLLHAGSSDLSYASLRALSSSLNPFWLRLAFIFIFVGYTAKMGLFPMFTAGIDAKDNAPSPAAALLASVLVNLGFVGIYRSFTVVAGTSLLPWANAMMITIAIITLLFASAYMIRVRNIKRMLAYSGIEQMALVTIGLAMGGVGRYAAILHIVLHTFVKSSLFFQFAQLARTFRSKMLDDMGGYLSLNPFGALVLLLGFFSITAVPPSGLFVSEFMVFKSMAVNGQWVLLAAVLLLLTVLIWALAKCIFSIVFMTPPAVLADAPKGIDAKRCALWENIMQLVLLVAAILLAYCPPAFLTELINQAAAL